MKECHRRFLEAAGYIVRLGGPIQSMSYTSSHSLEKPDKPDTENPYMDKPPAELNIAILKNKILWKGFHSLPAMKIAGTERRDGKQNFN